MQWEIGEKRILETLSSIPLDYHNVREHILNQVLVVLV